MKKANSILTTILFACVCAYSAPLNALATTTEHPVVIGSTAPQIMHTVVLQSVKGLPTVVLNGYDQNFESTLGNYKRYSSKELRQIVSMIDPNEIESAHIVSSGQTLNGRRVKGEAFVITLKPNTQSGYATILRNARQISGVEPDRKPTTINPTIIVKKEDGQTLIARYPALTSYTDLIYQLKNYTNRSTTLAPRQAVEQFGVSGINGATLIELMRFEGAFASILPRNSRSPFSTEQMYDCYVVPSYQVVVSRTKVKSTKFNQVLRIRNTADETFITMALPISYDSQWDAPNPKSAIEDLATGDRYHLRRLDGNLPLGKLLMFKGYKGKTLEITYVFPRIKDGVETIKWITLSKNQIILPRNSSPTQSFTVNVNEYLNKPDQADIY